MNSIFQVITLAWSLQGGQYLTNAMAYEDYFLKNSNYFVDIDFELHVPFSWSKDDENIFFIGASFENQFIKAPSFWGMAPRQDEYIFKTGIRFFEVEIGFEHMCSHPVEVQTLPSTKHFSSHDKVYVLIEGKI